MSEDHSQQPDSNHSNPPTPLSPLEDIDDIWDAPLDPPPSPSVSPPPQATASPPPPSSPPPSPPASRTARAIANFLTDARPVLHDLSRQTRPLLEKAQVWWHKTLPLVKARSQPMLKRGQDWWHETLPLVKARSQPTLNRIQAWWATILPKIRSVLPTSLQQALSDQALTSMIIGLLLVVLWVLPGLLSGPATVSQVPPPQTTPAPTALPSSTPIPPTPSGNPAPSIVATPAPILDLPPEQSLITTIQDQVAEVMNQYADGLIQSVQANFRSNRLIVRVSEEWSTLSPLRQSQLADEILRRAKDLSFGKLELIDGEGVLLARSPVVGDHMVILNSSS